jgi:hypothetical protein
MTGRFISDAGRRLVQPDALIKEDTRQLNTKSPQGVHLETVYRAPLRIVAYLDEQGFTGNSSDPETHQAEVMEHSSLADPASDGSTSPG